MKSSSPRDVLVHVAGTALTIENSATAAGVYYRARRNELKKYRTKPAIIRRPDIPSESPKASPATPGGIVKVRSTLPYGSSKASTKTTSSVRVRRHTRASPTKQLSDKSRDCDWRNITDYCPPVDSLCTWKFPFQTSWNREPLDISGAPDVEVLTEHEHRLACQLRLSPQQYLANKRRIFQACVGYLKRGKRFTKTAAQAACSIDVNKASALWKAFDSIGWFGERWFHQWL